MRIIGLSGKAGCGKTTVAKILGEKEQEFTILSFAFKLKEVCAVAFGFSHDQLYGHLKGEIDPFWGFSPRYALQQVGTELFRQFDKDFWVKAWWREIENKGYNFVVADDVRFPNEADFIKSKGGLLLRIDRDYTDPTIDQNHASEVSLDDYQGFDININNNVSMLTLHRTINTIKDLYVAGNIP